METIRVQFDSSGLGKWSTPENFFVDPERTKRYAAATNDTNPRHVTGELAPPIFGVVATVPHLQEALDQIIPAHVASLHHGVHGDQDMFLYHPIVPGTTLRVRVRPVGIRARSTGTAIITQAELRDGSGELVQEQYINNFIRGVIADASFGIEPPDHRMPADVPHADPTASVTYVFDPDQTYRYADASGDHTEYHIDDTAAKAAGFPGIFIHGLCTMAFVSRAVIETVCHHEPARLKRLAVRFSKPVFPSEAITVNLWKATVGNPKQVYRLEAVNSLGELVVRDGLAEVE